jgi:acyl-CoA thioesterase FadM
MSRAGAVPGRDQTPRFVTASLRVDFRRPTPLGADIVLTARPLEASDRKVIVSVSLSADDVECARGEVVAVPAPPSMRPAPAR